MHGFGPFPPQSHSNPQQLPDGDGADDADEAEPAALAHSAAQADTDAAGTAGSPAA